MFNLVLEYKMLTKLDDLKDMIMENGEIRFH